MKKVIFMLVSIALLFGCIRFCFAYNEDYVHPKINEHAVINSSLDTYLKNRLMLPNGVETAYNNKKIREWIIQGGHDEDAPERRGLVHYHDPYNKSWESAGLYGTWASSVFWAQNQQNVWLGDDMSWKTARTAYYDGLTATDNQIREEKLAKAFKAVGQTMHLISDMSVPAHTRDTAHPLNEPYEDCCE